jgi:hypothetical protein
MSIFQTVQAACPACGHDVDVRICDSVKADRAPELREEILARTFQQATCDACGSTFQAEPRLSYVDHGRGQWLLIEPRERLAAWAELEDHAGRLFEQAYGAGASAGARELGDGLVRRVTVGWPAAREKVLLVDRGLDDVTIELAKLLLLRTSPRPLDLASGRELRLVDVTDDTLVFAWLDDGAATEWIRAPRTLLDGLDASAWAAARAALTAGPYVDVDRLLVAAA